MGVKPETRYLDRIRELLTVRGAKLIKLHGSAYMKKGNPDIIGVLNGIPFVVETKYLHGDISDKQQYEMDEWRRAGTVVVSAFYEHDTPEDIESLVVLKVWLARRKIRWDENEATNRFVGTSEKSARIPPNSDEEQDRLCRAFHGDGNRKDANDVSIRYRERS